MLLRGRKYCAAEMETELLRHGVRMTRQRRAILCGIEGAERHLHAGQILRRALRIEPGVNRVTVYRTLSLLKRHGVIDAVDLLQAGGDVHCYERNTGRQQAHLVCRGCGRVGELAPAHLERLRQEIATEYEFAIEGLRLEVQGHCKCCKKQQDESLHGDLRGM